MDQPGIHISLAEPTNNRLEPKHLNKKKSSTNVVIDSEPQDSASSSTPSRNLLPLRYAQRVVKSTCKFEKFTGPGAIISVAYIDPDNCQSDLTAGALFGYRLLCAVVFSNFVAVFLQALETQLGCVTGMDMAQMNRSHLHPWVIGTAIPLNLLNPKITLIAGCVISVSDTLFILLFYNPDGSLRRLRFFELFISVFVFAIFIRFCIELSFTTAPAGEVFKGLLPSKTIFAGQGLFQSCAILGGDLMPHTIYLGSGLVQARMREFDDKNEKYQEPPILIIASASQSPDHGTADFPGMYNLFVNTIGAAAGTIFTVGLFSGVSAGIVATMAGQLVFEGAMDWRMPPFWRRLITRCCAIVPVVGIAAAGGEKGLGEALVGCTVVLSVELIFVAARLVWYTSDEVYEGEGWRWGWGWRCAEDCGG
ncbi:hypothetical protein BOTCAL_0202g00070 [Botryotinia calthae]|uniref:Manganese transporter n=1 Tax=Botryotinia calthae TaxID=38488 RepID=A0A4Y8CZ85_9HELO|nr:hypothetical protein BOTCAL_0202g00070 [Botryotinia calthae]